MKEKVLNEADIKSARVVPVGESINDVDAMAGSTNVKDIHDVLLETPSETDSSFLLLEEGESFLSSIPQFVMQEILDQDHNSSMEYIRSGWLQASRQYDWSSCLVQAALERFYSKNRIFKQAVDALVSIVHDDRNLYDCTQVETERLHAGIDLFANPCKAQAGFVLLSLAEGIADLDFYSTREIAFKIENLVIRHAWNHDQKAIVEHARIHALSVAQNLSSAKTAREREFLQGYLEGDWYFSWTRYFGLYILEEILKQPGQLSSAVDALLAFAKGECDDLTPDQYELVRAGLMWSMENQDVRTTEFMKVGILLRSAGQVSIDRVSRVLDKMSRELIEK